MSKKTDLVQALIKEVKLRHPVPSKPMEGASLLEQGAFLILLRHMTETQAEASVKALRAAYEDWNEIRVAQSQEIAQHLRTSTRKKGIALLRDRRDPSMAIKDYLQDVFQQTHHLDLEELRDEEGGGGKVALSLEELGFASAAYLMFVANDHQVPVHLPLMKLLERLDLMARTGSLKKGRALIEPLVPKGQELEFTLAMHEVLERWEDEKEPIYLTVPALQKTAYGQKAAKEREASMARADAAARREEERIRKEEERERKKAEVEAKKRTRELERKRKAEEKKLTEARAKAAAADAKRKEAADAKAAARKAIADEKAAAKKAIADEKAAAKKEAARLAAEAKKEAAAKKASAKKEAAARKASAKKPAAKKAAAKKPAAKKASTNKAAASKPAAKKATVKKATVKKAASKSPAAKKASTKKRASKKTTAKKAASKTTTTKKKASKKAASKKPSTRKKPTTK